MSENDDFAESEVDVNLVLHNCFAYDTSDVRVNSCLKLLIFQQKFEEKKTVNRFFLQRHDKKLRAEWPISHEKLGDAQLYTILDY